MSRTVMLETGTVYRFKCGSHIVGDKSYEVAGRFLRVRATKDKYVVVVVEAFAQNTIKGRLEGVGRGVVVDGLARGVHPDGTMGIPRLDLRHIEEVPEEDFPLLLGMDKTYDALHRALKEGTCSRTRKT